MLLSIAHLTMICVGQQIENKLKRADIGWNTSILLIVIGKEQTMGMIYKDFTLFDVSF